MIIVNVTQRTASLPPQLLTPKVNIGDYLCNLNPDLCISILQNISIPLPLPQRISNFIPDLPGSINAVFIVPIFVSYIFCLFQIFLLVKETKKFLNQLQRGECDYIVKAKYIKNPKIASYSFHFGG